VADPNDRAIEGPAFGRQICGDLEQAAQREWLVCDGLGGFAMGTVAGLLTRRYHGLLVVATNPPIGRQLGLVALDPVLVIGDRRIRLATHEWSSGAVDPVGYQHLEGFWIEDGIPRWRWAVGDVCLERQIAMTNGRPGVVISHRLVRGSAVGLELHPLCTWRDANAERLGSAEPLVEVVANGFTFERAYRVTGPGFTAGAGWYRGLWHRVEADRGLNAEEDVWSPGSFSGDLASGQSLDICAWAGDLATEPPPVAQTIRAARQRARQIVLKSTLTASTDQALVLAADQMIVAGPAVVAGYPWFGSWSRDTMTSYEGLFLETAREQEGRRLLLAAAATLSEGMLANTSDVGATQYNTADATLWFLHAVARHVESTGDADLAAQLADVLVEVIRSHVTGTRYGIHVDPSDGLLSQGEPGLALTWMDARVDGIPITQRAGKAIEINALWVNGLASTIRLLARCKRTDAGIEKLEAAAGRSFPGRFLRGAAVLDVAQGPNGDSLQVRPNCLLAISLPHAPLDQRWIVEKVGRSLLTSLGMRSLAPDDPAYEGHHQGDQAERDRAYHQGTVWPWLIGPYVEAALKVGIGVDGVLDGLERHLGEWGLGSVSETTDGDPPHRATGAPFQAWSIAEMLRASRLIARRDQPDRPVISSGGGAQ
jgi:predicted glycogen debranching enzyme